MDKEENNNDKPKEVNVYKIGQLLYSYRTYDVHLGFNSLTKEEVTIKIINKKYINGNTKLLTFVNNEILFTRILSHNNILQLLETYETPLYVFIIMEKFKGELLSTYMNKHKKLEESKALKIFSKIINAMNYIHNMNICHLNINLESIIIDDNDENLIKIFDFKYGQYYYAKFKTLSENVGTNMFTCPEMFSIDSYYPELADVWSCGIILSYLLTGSYPINPDKELDIEDRYVIPKNINEDLQDLLKNILNIDIDKRYRFDDIVGCKYFVDKGYDTIILEESNNYRIDETNLKKIYERYLKAKVSLGKEDFPNALINLDILINRDELPDNKRMSKLIEMFGKTNNNNNDLIFSKKNNSKGIHKKGKDNTKMSDNNTDNLNLNKNEAKNTTFTQFRFNKNKIKSENNKTNFNKKPGVKGKRKSVFEFYGRFPQKSFLFEIPENLILDKIDFKSQRAKDIQENEKKDFTGRKFIKKNTKVENNMKFLGNKISSSVGRRRGTQFAIIEEKYTDYDMFNEVNKKNKKKVEEKKENQNKANKTEIKTNNKNELTSNYNSDKPIFNFDELYEDAISDKEESNNEEKEKDDNNISDKNLNQLIKSNEIIKKTSSKNSNYLSKQNNDKSQDLEFGINRIISNRLYQNKATLTVIKKKKKNDENENIKIIKKKNDNLAKKYNVKARYLDWINKKEKLLSDGKQKTDINNLPTKRNGKTETLKKKNEKYNNAEDKINQKQNDKSSYINITNKKANNDSLFKNKNLNSKMVVNKSSDNVIKINKKNDNQNLLINTKLNKNDYLTNYTSKTPINDNIIKKQRTTNKNYRNEDDNASPHFFSSNRIIKIEDKKDSQSGNYYTSNYFYNGRRNESDSDEDESEKAKRKMHQIINLIQKQNDMKAQKLEGEKVIIRKFTKRTKTPELKGILKKGTLFSKGKREKLEDKADDEQSIFDNRSYLASAKKLNITSKKSSIADSVFDFEIDSKKKLVNIKNFDNYDTILKNLKDINNVFEQSEENNAYHQFIRRKITPDKTLKKTKIDSDNDNSNNSDNNSSNSNDNNMSDSESERYKSKFKKKNNLTDLIKNKMLNNIKYKSNKMSKSESISENNSSIYNKSENINNKIENIKINNDDDNNDNDNNNNNDILNEVDNFNFINNEYSRIKYEMNKNKNNSKSNLNSKIFSPSSITGKQNETETELSSGEQKQKNFSNSKNSLLKVKNNLRERLISVSSDLSEEKVETFSGNVIDIKYISLKNYEQTVNILISELHRKGVKFKKIDYNSYKCTKGIRQFYVDIVKIPKNIFYYRFYSKRKQINNFK